MFIDIIVSLFLTTVVVTICGICVYIFVKHPEVLIMVIFVAIILIGLIIAPAVAEEVQHITLKDYVVNSDSIDGEPVLRIDFKHKGNKLSLYWEGELDTSRSLVVEIWDSVECIDAYYAPCRNHRKRLSINIALIQK